MLVFPKGVRFVKANEIPDTNSEKQELLEKIRSADISQGYVIGDSQNSLFNFYAEVNVNAPRIWEVFRDLCEVLLPEEAMPIIGEFDEEPLHNGKYDDKKKLLELFEEHRFYLENDCFIQFGLGYESETELAEVFVAPTKHFQVWTNDADAFKLVMKKYEIPEFEKLQFIDEFPKATPALDYTGKFHNYDELLNFLKETFGDYDNSNLDS